MHIVGILQSPDAVKIMSSFTNLNVTSVFVLLGKIKSTQGLEGSLPVLQLAFPLLTMEWLRAAEV